MATLKNKNEIYDMSMPKSFIRSQAFPLDVTNVWTSYEDALAYAQDETQSPYIGQILSVVENGSVTLWKIAVENNTTVLKRVDFVGSIPANLSDSKNNGLTVNNDGSLTTYIASSSQRGSVIIGDGITVAEDGTISAKTATTAIKGYVQIGEGLDIDNGVLSTRTASTAQKGYVQIGDGININNGVISGQNKLVKVNADSGSYSSASVQDDFTVVGGEAVSTSISGKNLTVDVNYDDDTIGINSDDELYVKDGSIVTSKLPNSTSINDGVTNAKLAFMPPNNIKGNNTSEYGIAKDLTIQNVRDMLGSSSNPNTDNNVAFPNGGQVYTFVNNSIETKVNTLDKELVGSDGAYIKTIKEDDGVITATKENFDTVINSDSSNNNAPTSLATKTYIDGKINALDWTASSTVTKTDNISTFISNVTQTDGQISVEKTGFVDNISTGANSDIAPTTKAIKQYIDNSFSANDAMMFKGTIGTNGTISQAQFLAMTDYSAGWTYRVVSTGVTIDGHSCDIGDLIICTKDYNSSFNVSDWTIAQANIDGALYTNESGISEEYIPVFDSNSNRLKSSTKKVADFTYGVSTGLTRDGNTFSVVYGTTTGTAYQGNLGQAIRTELGDRPASESRTVYTRLTSLETTEASLEDMAFKENVNTADLVNSSVTTDKIADSNVTTVKINDGAVTHAKLATDAVETGNIKDSNVTTAKIADSNVTTAKINDGAVTTIKIADSNITTVKIADSNVTTAKLNDGAVTTAKIADSNVTTAKILDNNVTDAKINTVSFHKITQASSSSVDFVTINCGSSNTVITTTTA